MPCEGRAEANFSTGSVATASLGNCGVNDVRLEAALGLNDRVSALYTGKVRIQGVELVLRDLSPSEIFRRMCSDHAFHVSEMSLGALSVLSARKDNPFVGMPAFVSRAFRHAMVYVHADSSIETAEDLNGKRIGIREWGMTALVWIIGILSEYHGFEPRSVDWYAAMPPRVPIALPGTVSMRELNGIDSIHDMLARHELDAVMMLEEPRALASGAQPVRRLFEDVTGAERNYFAATGIHPMMHAVVLRADIQQRHPMLIERIYGALCESKDLAMEALADTGVLSVMLPFLHNHVDETRAVFGADFWPYGMQANAFALERLLHYAHQQWLTPHLLAPQALFSPLFTQA